MRKSKMPSLMNLLLIGSFGTLLVLSLTKCANERPEKTKLEVPYTYFDDKETGVRCYVLYSRLSCVKVK